MKKNKNQQIVMVVGPDMTGKTQIAQELSRRTGIPYFKASSEHGTYLNKSDLFIQQLRYADTRMVDFLKQTGHSVIFDRAYPCERVYSSVMGRATDEILLRHIDREYAYLGAKVIICARRSYEGITDDIDPKIDKNILQRLDAAYQDFFQWSSCKALALYVDDEDLDRELREITVFLGM